jgi:DNA topoisomerase-1
MVALLDATSIRIGNEEYVRANGSYGLATLRRRHVTFKNGAAMLRFKGKGGLHREVNVTDRRLMRFLKDCHRLEGSRLFQYVDDAGAVHTASAADVNQYLHELSGQSFTAKDFRTWKASARVAADLMQRTGARSLTARKLAVRDAIHLAAEALGNTPAICRKYYVHPELLNSFECAALPPLRRPRADCNATGRLAPDEAILACFLRKCTRPSSRARTAARLAS